MQRGSRHHCTQNSGAGLKHKRAHHRRGQRSFFATGTRRAPVLRVLSSAGLVVAAAVWLCSEVAADGKTVQLKAAYIY